MTASTAFIWRCTGMIIGKVRVSSPGSNWKNSFSFTQFKVTAILLPPPNPERRPEIFQFLSTFTSASPNEGCGSSQRKILLFFGYCAPNPDYILSHPLICLPTSSAHCYHQRDKIKKKYKNANVPGPSVPVPQPELIYKTSSLFHL